MASGREKAQVLSVSSDDEIEYVPQMKRMKSTPQSNAAGTSASANRDDVENIAPSPKIIRLEKKLKTFLKDISNSFPWTKFGSNRDAYCYKRVRGHLQVFKRECLEQRKNFVDSKQWKSAIDYIIIAWPCVDEMPRWDDAKYKKVNEQCYKKLTSHLSNSLKKGTFRKQELQHYINKFEKLARGTENKSESDDVQDNGMQNSIKMAETILKKMK